MKKNTLTPSKKKVLILFMLLLFLFSIIKIGGSLASTEPFALTNVSVSNKSDTVEVNNINFDKTTIKNDITFHKVGDNITYKITIVNSESEIYTIKSLTDDNTNEYVNYEYSKYEGIALQPNEEKTFEITAKYVKEVTDISKRDQSFKTIFTFTLEDSNGNIVNQNITTSSNPKTGDNILIYIITAVISLIALVILLKRNKITTNSFSNKGKHSKNGIKFFCLFFAIAILFPVISKAADNSFTITLENTYKLYDKVVISKTIDGVTELITVPYNEIPQINTPVKNNFNFINWCLEDGTTFDTTKPLTKDITLNAKWGESKSDISISVTDEDDWKPSKTVTINYNVQNTDKEYENQYSLDNGTTWNKYTNPIELTQNNITIQARTIIKENNKVIGTVEKTVTKIDPVVPTVGITLGDRYYSGQELDLSTVTTATAGESGYTLKWYIDDLEISNLSETNKIDKIESEYEIKVKAVATSGAGLEGETYSGTIIVQYALWDNFLVGPLTRDNIQTLKFGSWANRPTNGTEVDISYNDSGTVFEYYTLDPNTNLYDVYITSPYGYTRYYTSDMSELFAHMPKVKTIDFEYLDMFNITNMNYMFCAAHPNAQGYYVQEPSELSDIKWGEKFNTKNVTTIGATFTGLINLTSLDLSSFDVSNVTNINGIFQKCSKLENLDVENWNTSKITDMALAFDSVKTKKLNLNGWDTSKVTNMFQMFYNAKIEEFNIEKWNLSSVTNMSMMFCRLDVEDLDLSGWNTSNVTTMDNMFWLSKVKTIDFRHLDLSNASDVSYMFDQAYNLTNVYVEQMPTYKAGANTYGMWGGAKTNNFTVKEYND